MDKLNLGATSGPDRKQIGLIAWIIWWAKWWIRFVRDAPTEVFMSALLKVCNRLKVVVVLYPLSVLISAMLFKWNEGGRYLDGFWWSVVTSVTLGYGDLYPKTDLGRYMAMFFMIYWFVLGTVFVVNLLKHIVDDPNAWTDAEQRRVLYDTHVAMATIRVVDTNLRILTDALNQRLGLGVVLLPTTEFDAHGDIVAGSIALQSNFAQIANTPKEG